MSTLRKILYVQLLFILLFLCKSAYADIKIENHIPSFLDSYSKIDKSNMSKVKKFITRYENIDNFNSAKLFYEGHPMPKDPETLVLLNQYAKELTQVAEHYPNKVQEVQSVIREVDQKIQDLFGVKVNAIISLCTSTSPSDSVTVTEDSSKYTKIAVNLHAISKSSKDDVRILLAHELFHVVQQQVSHSQASQGLIDGNLYNEGWATYASSLIIPGLPEWKYISYRDKSDSELQRFESQKKTVIKTLLKDWNKKSDVAWAKYFSGSPEASYPFVPRSGYYIGYMAAKKMAQSQPSVKVALLHYSEFKKKIKPVLKELSEVG